MTNKMMLLRADQTYIDMLTDTQFFYSRQLTEHLAKQPLYRSSNAVIRSFNTVLNVFDQQQRSIRYRMVRDYNRYITRVSDPRGMIYLIDHQCEYLVFAPTSFVILLKGYHQSVKNLTQQYTVEYHD